jgi:hypothetical protein
MYVFAEHGESEMQPLAECWLSDAAISACLARGVMPVASVRGRNSVRVVRLQSMAIPPTPLGG